MRSIPVISRRELEKNNTGEVFLVFVSITHPEITDEINLVVDGYDYIWNGKTWHKSYFELEILTDDDSPPQANFSFPNVKREAMARLSTVVQPCRVAFYIVASSYFDLSITDENTPRPALVTPQTAYKAERLFLTSIKADPIMVSGSLRSWDYRTEMWPNKRVTKALLPGVYAR